MFSHSFPYVINKCSVFTGISLVSNSHKNHILTAPKQNRNTNELFELHFLQGASWFVLYVKQNTEKTKYIIHSSESVQLNKNDVVINCCLYVSNMQINSIFLRGDTFFWKVALCIYYFSIMTRCSKRNMCEKFKLCWTALLYNKNDSSFLSLLKARTF